MQQEAVLTTGSCLCGTVRWEADAPFERMSHCHCAMCRNAAAFATYVIAPKAQFRWVAGSDSVTSHWSSPAFQRAFCSNCGSVVPGTENGNMVEIPAGCLDDDPGIRPMRHIFAASKAPWYNISDNLPRVDAYPPGNDSPVIDWPDRRSKKPGILHGSCLCGAVEYEVSTPIRVTRNCHCSRCRKARAAAHTTNGFTETAGLTFTRGDELVRNYKVPDARTFTHSFCGKCGGGLPNPRSDRSFVAIPLGSLDDDPGVTAVDHIFTNDKAVWFDITDDLPQFPEGPDQPPAALFQDG
jgi:hypothetical protein